MTFEGVDPSYAHTTPPTHFFRKFCCRRKNTRGSFRCCSDLKEEREKKDAGIDWHVMEYGVRVNMPMTCCLQNFSPFPLTLSPLTATVREDEQKRLMRKASALRISLCQRIVKIEETKFL